MSRLLNSDTRILLVVPGYPSNGDPYNNMFVHSRVLAYQKAGLDVDVFSVGKRSESTQYEGISVRFGTLHELSQQVRSTHYTKILVHFGLAKILNTLEKEVPTIPLIIWVHGYEALSWKRRILFFEPSAWYRIPAYLIVNTLQRKAFARFILSRKAPLHFVFVSQWMRDVFAADLKINVEALESSIIPNAIDTQQFEYQPKPIEQRTKILSIRPYTSRKYANDLSVKAVLLLSKTDQFNQMTFSFFGKGRDFQRITKPLRKFKNVHLNETYLTHAEITQLHQTHGIMLIPTRQDSQGVSMGEAMSSGLVPISSYNTAIPEFLDDKSGYLTHNAQEIADAILTLINDPALFMAKSQCASQRVQQQCAVEKVISEEMKLITASSLVDQPI